MLWLHKSRPMHQTNRYFIFITNFKTYLARKQNPGDSYTLRYRGFELEDDDATIKNMGITKNFMIVCRPNEYKSKDDEWTGNVKKWSKLTKFILLILKYKLKFFKKNINFKYVFIKNKN